MKSLKLSAAPLLFLLASCSSDVEEPQPGPGPGPDEVKLMEIDEDYYSSPGSSTKSLLKTVVTVDSNQHTITTWFKWELRGDGYQRRYFDEAWRLTKIIDFNTWTDTDTIVIQRPGAGLFDIGKENSPKSRYTVTASANGSRIISAVIPNGDPQAYNHRIIDQDGLLVYSGVSRWGNYETAKAFHHFVYNANHQLIAVKDTNYNLSGSGILAFEHAITKNNSSNAAFIDFMKTMVGTDMEWILYDSETGVAPFRFVFEFSNLVFLQNGAFVSNNYTIHESTNGTTYNPVDPWHYTYETGYDSRGRLTGLKIFENQKIDKDFRIRYPD